MAYADRKVLLRLLKWSSVGLIPEGVAGIFQGANRNREAIFVSDRHGFVKVAIQAGTGGPSPSFNSTMM
jgi:hypothetical protein